MSAPAVTDYRTLALLAACQALLLINAAGLITINGLVGHMLADTKALATLGATTYVIGSALAAMPAALWMARVGRRAGFMAGALINIAGCAIAALALQQRSFVLFCAATAIIGVYQAVGLQYRFAAAEVAAPADRAKAISWVLAGGIAGGIVGPESMRFARDWFSTPFTGSFVALAGFALVALAVQSRVHVPPPTRAERSGAGRPLADIVRQPVFVVAVLAAALGYGVMNLLMVATPLAMDFCSHPFAQAALVIQWHVVAMYAPGLFTGTLIKRFGVLRIIVTGVVLMGGCVAVALSGTSVAHFLVALALLGVGWNFMYTGGTTLLIDAHTPAEKARAQGANDFAVFATMGVSSAASGALVSLAGWERMNAAALPALAVVVVAVAWLARLRGARAASM
ncbi:Riboflavin transporter RfnT [Burkholderiales bacterium]|nr:Riboflavin transporter RfnT [Burkholderiales bacterium]